MSHRARGAWQRGGIAILPPLQPGLRRVANGRWAVTGGRAQPDGLAMSSRNVYLGAQERAAAPDLHAALLAAQNWASRGASAIEARAAAERVLSSQPQFSIEYISCADLDSGAELADGERASHVMLSAAVRVGNTRLIDNVVWE